ncbi:MAG TPA: hypothetical protein PK678_14375, partial [Ferruginibacter sp.]|nr:hypothetical protein [Ferruginibacter sp.]
MTPSKILIFYSKTTSYSQFEKGKYQIITKVTGLIRFPGADRVKSRDPRLFACVQYPGSPRCQLRCLMLT